MTGCIAAGHPLTAEAGAAVLRDGGNAVDAAVAAILASWAAEPLLTGPGAGGYMLVAGAGEKPVLLDFFVAAPGDGADVSARAELVPAEVSFGDALQVFHCGAASCGVYGMTAGLAAALERWGSVDAATLAAPAARLARDGVPVNAAQAYVFNLLAPILLSTTGSRASSPARARCSARATRSARRSWPRRSSASAPTARRPSTPGTSPRRSWGASSRAAASSPRPTCRPGHGDPPAKSRNLERRHDEISAPETDYEWPSREEILQQALAQPLETRNQRDAREIEQQQERRAMQRRRLRDNEAEIVRRTGAMDAVTQAGWETWLRSRLDAERDHWREVIPEMVALERERTDAELTKLRAGLELKIDALAAELNKQRAVADGSIADLLPPVPQRKRGCAT